MKRYLRHHALAVCLLAPAGAFVAAIPGVASAQARATGQAAAPVIHGLQVNADNALAAGSQLQFTVEGTPRADVRIGLDDNRITVPLEESARGVYRGSYTVRRADRIDPSGVIRVSLASGGRTAVTNYTYPPSFVVASGPPRNMQPAAAPLTIERFTAVAVDRIEPGTVLRYRLVGAPGGVASFDIPGVANRIEMRETRPGHYEGSYTVRRNDNLQALDNAVATLRAGNDFVTAELDRLRIRDANRAMGSAPALPMAIPVQLLSPGNNAAVDGSQVIVQGRATPGAMVRVKVDAVSPAQGNRMSVAQPVLVQTVQADRDGNFSFSFGQPRMMPAPGTRYEVSAESLDGGQSSESRLVLFQRG